MYVKDQLKIWNKTEVEWPVKKKIKYNMNVKHYYDNICSSESHKTNRTITGQTNKNLQ